MTILTPRFSEQPALHTNGAAGTHVTAAHEPTREGEQPITPAGTAAAPEPPVGAAPAGALKVAMIGTAPSSNMLAPYNDPSWTIWACSPGNMNKLPRVDVWFELHSNLLWPEYENYGKPYIEWLKQQKFPIWMQDQSLVPQATPLPMYDLVNEFGRSFFTSSFAWMMALAIKMGAVEIALYGIDMASREEYILQRPGFFFFRHEANKRGIKVSAPYESDIMQDPPLYAYVDSTPLGRKIRARAQEVNGRIAPMEQQHAQIGNNITYLKGAKEDLDYFDSIWSGAATDLVLQRHQIAAQDAEIAALKAKICEMEELKPAFIPMNMTIGMTPSAVPPDTPAPEPQPLAS